MLGGNLTRDPELRYTPSGVAIATSSVAVNRKWKTEGGEEREEVTFAEFTAFGRTAENIGQYFRKGSPIFIEGRLKLDQWDDKQTGQKRYKLHVICETFQFCNGPKEGGESGSNQQRQTQPAGRQQTRREPPPSDNDGPPPEEDDVPF